MTDTTYSQLQKDIDTWARANFVGQQDAAAQLMGMTEEIGELAHSTLKSANGLRGTKEQHLIDAADAIGDIMVFFLAYCNALGKSLSSIIDSDVHLQAIDTNNLTSAYILKIAADHGKICDAQSGVGQLIGMNVRQSLELDERIRWFYVSLSSYCEHMGWDVFKIVCNTWEHVKQRDWRKYPLDGVSK